MQPEVKIIKGDKHIDERGVLQFINSFDLKNIRRMYFIEPANTELIRAWQGHKTEWKYFLVTQGSFTIGLVKIDNWEKPSKNTTPYFYDLDSIKPCVLVVPGGYANGIKSNQAGSKLMVLSSSTIEDAQGDEFRFPDSNWNFPD